MLYGTGLLAVLAGCHTAWVYWTLSGERARHAAQKLEIDSSKATAPVRTPDPLAAWLSERPEHIPHQTLSQRLDRACHQHGASLASLSWASTPGGTGAGLERHTLSATLRGSYPRVLEVVAAMLDDHPSQLTLVRLGVRRLAPGTDVEAQVEWALWARATAASQPAGPR